MDAAVLEKEAIDTSLFYRGKRFIEKSTMQENKDTFKRSWHDSFRRKMRWTLGWRTVLFLL